MKRYLLVLAALTAMSVLATAAAVAADPATQPARKAPMHAKALGLSDEQKAAARAIMQKARDDAAKAQTKEQRVQIYKAALAKIRAEVLTEEQRAKVDQLRQRIRETCGRAAREGLAQAGGQLGLSDEQKASAQEILSAARQQAQQAATVAEKAKIMREAFAKVRSDVLNDQQRAKADEMKAQAKQRCEEFRKALAERMRQRWHQPATSPAAAH
jgi:hypothetical protein